MSTNLNLIALISGGKDSIFSIYHCRAHGHKVVALANLYPTGDGQDSEDIDSFMYQTVGYTSVPFYGKAFQIPLFRGHIQGTAVNSDKYYNPSILTRSAEPDSSQDETESLFGLLHKIKSLHPEANAVSAGAILSDYQRSRVESVVLRLGLQSLAYLWQYPYLPPHTQTSLLEDMEAVGHKAIIIKVASGGLNESFLGQNVADSQTIPKLRRALERFGPLQGGSILGEGGEYETLSVDGPGDLWKESMEVDPKDSKIITGEGGTAALSVRNSKSVAKNDSNGTSLRHLRVPDGPDAEFRRLKQDLELYHPDRIAHRSRDNHTPVRIAASKQFSVCRTKYNLYINNLSNPSDFLERKSIEEQISVIIDRLTSLLRQNDLSASDVTSSTLILRSMSDFKTINSVYGALFSSRPQPPARVTVACGSSLPPGVDVTLSLVVNRLGPSFRRGLHVQSISYWAPANIGPYSQAISTASPSPQAPDEKRTEVVYLAGQIPLVPATMELVNEGKSLVEFKEQTVLSLQHLWRVGRAMSVENWLGGIAFIAAPSGVHGSVECSVRERADVARYAWRAVYDVARELQGRDEHEDSDDDVDVWDRVYGRSQLAYQTPSTVVDTRPLLPNLARVESKSRMYNEVDISEKDSGTTPPCFVIEVDELPRGAQIEWTSLGLVNGDVEIGIPADMLDNPGTTDAAPRKSVSLKDPEYCDYLSCRIKQTGEFFVWIGIDDVERMEFYTSCVDVLNRHTVPPARTLYTTQNLPDSFACPSAIQVIPCRSIWGRSHERLAALLFFQAEGDEKQF